MLSHVSIGMVMGYLGIVLALLSTFMPSMQPLRMIALIGNLVGLSFGYMESVWPTFFGNLLLLPINGMRLWEIRKLLRDMENARTDTSITDLLLPHMKMRRVKAGTVLFRKGDNAEEMLYLQNGVIRLPEFDKQIREGSLFGEVGLFSRDSKRSASAVCETECEIYGMTREQLYLLYYQDPRIGFNLISLVVENLLPASNKSPPPVPAPAAAPLSAPAVASEAA